MRGKKSQMGDKMKSIRTKLWVGMMVLVAFVILLLWLFQIVFLGKFYSVLEINQVISKADVIVSEIESLGSIKQLGNKSEILSEIDNFAYSGQLTVQLIDPVGNIVYSTESSGSMMSGMMSGMFKDVILRVKTDALSGKVAKEEAYHQKFGTKIMEIGIPVISENSVIGAVIISMPMTPVETTASILEKQLIIITVILLLAAAVISLILSKIFTKPVLAISRLAESYSTGKYDDRLNNISKDEIGQLAQRMNMMGDELMKNEMLQKELVSNVSHELRTPLTLIRGYAETLRDVTGDIPDKREKQLGIIIEETERLGSIVEDILNLSQLQAGVVTLDIEPFSIDDMLKGIKSRYELKDGSRIFEIVGASELDFDLIGDKRRIEQVFYNLINNAFNHTEINDRVEIAVIPKEGTARIEVRDTGQGIDEKDLDHIFERYYKGKRPDGKKSSGTGLGLAIVKSIFEMHQAPYGVESKVGSGTTFWFELKKA